MPAEFRVLALNPGSSSTKIGVFLNERAEWTANLRHSAEELAPFRGRPIPEQEDFRRAAIEGALLAAGYALDSFHAIAARGGLLRPLPSGTYAVNARMLDDLRGARRGPHASNLGAILARSMADASRGEAYITDPVSVEEWPERARISGLRDIERQCLSHALNTKAVARRYARERGVPYARLRLIVAHLGSGISISAHQEGRMIDVADPRNEGPFSCERTGALPARELVRLCYRGLYAESQMLAFLESEGGLQSYLGTGDLSEVERRMAGGDGRAALIFDAMVYQIAKEIGAMATVLHGRVDAILATAGMAHSARLIAALRPAVEWIAALAVYPGEDELQALAEGALRVLRGEESALEY